jgi:hypothetical protein
MHGQFGAKLKQEAAVRFLLKAGAGYLPTTGIRQEEDLGFAMHLSFIIVFPVGHKHA